MNNTYKNYKIILLGDSNVGKSSLVQRYVNDDFSHKFTVTVGTDYKCKLLKEKNIKISMWDTAGQEKYGDIIKSYYKNCDCYIVLFDITNQESFIHLEKWLENIKYYSCNDNNFIVIVGTKKDLNKSRTVSKNEIENFVIKNNFEYFEISSKNNDNIDMLFNHIIDIFIKKYDESMQVEYISYRKKISSALTFNNKQNCNEKKKSCC